MTDINENAIMFIEITLGESIVVKITTKGLSECNISQYNENFDIAYVSRNLGASHLIQVLSLHDMNGGGRKFEF